MIVIVGFMGAGKSTVGPLVAAGLGLPFVDADDVIVNRHGSIASIFSTEGERAFREAEAAVIGELLDGPDSVLSVGGGALGAEITRDGLAPATVVHLSVDYDEALRRVGHDADRPMLQRDTEALYRERVPTYQTIADITVDTNGATPDEVAERVVASVREVVHGD